METAKLVNAEAGRHYETIPASAPSQTTAGRRFPTVAVALIVAALVAVAVVAGSSQALRGEPQLGKKSPPRLLFLLSHSRSGAAVIHNILSKGVELTKYDENPKLARELAMDGELFNPDLAKEDFDVLKAPHGDKLGRWTDPVKWLKSFVKKNAGGDYNIFGMKLFPGHLVDPEHFDMVFTPDAKELQEKRFAEIVEAFPEATYIIMERKNRLEAFRSKLVAEAGHTDFFGTEQKEYPPVECVMEEGPGFKKYLADMDWFFDSTRATLKAANVKPLELTYEDDVRDDDAESRAKLTKKLLKSTHIKKENLGIYEDLEEHFAKPDSLYVVKQDPIPLEKGCTNWAEIPTEFQEKYGKTK